MDLKPVGQRIKQARENAHITQEELAATVNCTSQHISAIERGIKTPRLDTFIAIANAIRVSADVLLQDALANAIDPLNGEFSAILGALPEEMQYRLIRAIRAFSEK